MSVPALRFKEFSGDWEEKALGEIADIKRGASPRPISDKKWFSGESKVGWVRISDVTRSSKYLTNTEQYLSREGISKSRLVKQGNIIMSICATIGKPIYTTFDVCIHDGFVVFENLQISHDYLFYYLILIEKKWYQYGQPGSQVNLNSDIVSNEKISIPSLPEQSKIANFLTAVDEKITLLTKKADLLSQYKKGVMQQIFGQELRFKDDDGQEFPEWEESELGKVSTITMGQSPDSKSYNDIDEGQPLIQGNADISNRKTNPRIWTSQPTKECKINDIILTVRAPVGAVAKSYHNACIGRGVCAIRNIDKGTTNFIYQLLLWFEPTKWVSLEQGSTFTAVNSNDIKTLTIPVPCLKEQTKIANFLTAIDEKITTNQTQLNAVKQYKQGLLQQMFV